MYDIMLVLSTVLNLFILKFLKVYTENHQVCFKNDKIINFAEISIIYRLYNREESNKLVFIDLIYGKYIHGIATKRF